MFLSLFIYLSHYHPHLHSFPTRRSSDLARRCQLAGGGIAPDHAGAELGELFLHLRGAGVMRRDPTMFRCEAERSEEHTSELQSPCNLVCRLLLEKKKHDELLDLHIRHQH